MTTEEKMTIDERWKYLRTMRKRYRGADRRVKGQLLDEMEAVTGLHRKSLIRLMNGNLTRRPRRRQRGKTYGPEVDDALRVIYESYDRICAERLTPNLVTMAEQLDRHGELRATPKLLDQLGRISISTVQRRLDRIRQDCPRLRRKTSRSSSKANRDIPMKRLAWDLPTPGYFEVDLVHHCGPTTRGEYLHTLQMIDVATGWSERRAVLGRAQVVMEDAFQVLLARLPFALIEIHTDNGSEFFGDHLLRFWGERVKGVTRSRSRPYHKNDNPRVEQKNATLVRAYLGNERLDTVEQVLAVNHLYDKMWAFYNLFQPVMHLVEKEIIQDQHGATRVRRRHDKARTPFQRACDAKVISPDHKNQLEALRDSINPRRLRQEIDEDLQHIFSLPCAEAGSTQNVYFTLSNNGKKAKSAFLDIAFNCTVIQ